MKPYRNDNNYTIPVLDKPTESGGGGSDGDVCPCERVINC